MGLLDRLFGRDKEHAPEPATPEPRAELDASLDEAQRRHRSVRNEAARAVAEASVATTALDDAADEVGEARGLATEALRRAEAARTSGRPEEAQRWEQTARGVAGRLVAAEERLAALREPAERAMVAADAARRQEAEAAGELAELVNRRRELLGDLAGAGDVDVTPPEVEERLDRVQDHVDRRVAEASARAELDALESPELDSPDDERADAALDDLRRQLDASGS